MILTINEYIILRAIEQSPGLTAYGLHETLSDTTFMVPGRTVRDRCRQLLEYGAIEVVDEGNRGNRSTRWKYRKYRITDVGREYLNQLWDWFGDREAA